MITPRIAAAALTCLLIAGCSAPAAKESSDTEKRTVTHLFGELEIPVAPERVVVLDAGNILEAVVALDVRPIGVIVPKSTGDLSPAIADRLPDDVTVISNSEGDVDVERILTADPDLIVVTSEGESQREFYEQVRGVAPTVAVDDTANRWRDAFTELAGHLGKADTAKHLLDDYDARIDDARRAFGPDHGTASVVRVRTDRLNYMAQDGAFIWTPLRDIGFRAPSGQDVGAADDSFFEVSLEQTNLLDADRIFVVADGGAAAPGQLLDVVRANPLFDRLRGRIEILPANEYLFGNILTANRLLDVLDRQRES